MSENQDLTSEFSADTPERSSFPTVKFFQHGEKWWQVLISLSLATCVGSAPPLPSITSGESSGGETGISTDVAPTTSGSTGMTTLDPLSSSGAGPGESSSGETPSSSGTGGSCIRERMCVWRTLGVGNFHGCGLSLDDTIHCWGIEDLSNLDYGQVRNTPRDSGFELLAVGGNFSCAQKDGVVICWGGNAPDVPPGLHDFKRLAAGSSKVCGIRQDDTLECWGAYAGDPIVNVPSGGFESISVGGWHACGIRANSSVECWGLDSDNSVNGAPNGEGYVNVAAGQLHSCAVNSAGGVECWGCLRANGCVNDSEQVSGAPITFEYDQVWAGPYQSCGLEQSGDVDCWGSKGGYGVVNPPSTPLATLGTAVNYCLCGLDEFGSGICWGRNDYGQCDPPF